MTRTTAPTTLAEYQEHVRKEALKIQLDMGWPDEKLNEALKALGLPEKVTHYVPVEVTGRAFVLVKIDDTVSEEEARAQVAGKAGEDLAVLLQSVGVGLGAWSPVVGSVLDAMPTSLKEGDPDCTMSNQSVAHAKRGTRYCETYDQAGRHYCTRPKDHEGQHAYGNGRTIVSAWDPA